MRNSLAYIQAMVNYEMTGNLTGTLEAGCFERWECYSYTINGEKRTCICVSGSNNQQTAKFEDTKTKQAFRGLVTRRNGMHIMKNNLGYVVRSCDVVDYE